MSNITDTTANPIAQLPGNELVRVAQAGLLIEADVLRKDMIRALYALPPLAIVTLAASRAPGQTTEQAMGEFAKDVAAYLAALAAAGEVANEAYRAERERMASVVAAATHRQLEIVGIVEGIASRIRCSESIAEGKRKNLRGAGLTAAELESVAAPFDPAKLLAEREALLAEQVALDKFLKTRDPEHLPEGFAEAA